MKLYHPEDSDTRAAAALRWGSAGLLVVALHAGLGWWITRNLVAATPPDTVKGIPIDLEPVATPTAAPEPTPTTGGGPAPTSQAAAAPAEPQLETPPQAQPTPEPPEAKATAEPPPEPPQPEPPKAPEPPQPAEPPPAVEPTPTPEPPMPEPQPAPEPPLEPPQAVAPSPPSVQPTPEPPPPVALPQKDTKSDAVLAPPPPKRPPPPDPKAVAREAARRKAEAEKRAEQRAARAEARARAQAAARATRAAQVRDAGGPSQAETPPSSASSGASVATWRGAVQAHLRSFTPSGTGTSGTARVSFSVDRSGRVVSASLAGSSGDASLDSAAVAMVRRASPVPAPPPELGGRVSLSVPVHFQ